MGGGWGGCVSACVCERGMGKSWGREEEDVRGRGVGRGGCTWKGYGCVYSQLYCVTYLSDDECHGVM